MSLDSSYSVKEIREICKINASSYSKKDNWDFFNYLDTKNITKGEINEIKHLNPTIEKIPSRAKRKVNIDDIIISTVRPNQEHYGIIKYETDNFLVSTGFTTLTVDKTVAIPKFIYYYITQNHITNSLQTIAEQSTTSYPSIKPSDIGDLVINLPPIDIQKKISNILSSIEDKIEINKRINKNLDDLCHSLFKYYFIDFIPFYDDDFIDSDIGEIPKEWSITTVGNILDCKLGGTPSRSNESYWGGDIAWINSGKVNDFRIIEPSEYITEKGLKKSATKLLPAKTTVIAITGATLGQISLLEIDSCANQSVIGIIPNINYPYEFVYPLISSILIDLLKHQTGGAQQHINKNNVESFKIICPPAEIISEYKRIVSPIYSKISANCFEIEKLQKLSDTLLPKLMSGEIDVSKINCDLE